MCSGLGLCPLSMYSVMEWHLLTLSSVVGDSPTNHSVVKKGGVSVCREVAGEPVFRGEVGEPVFAGLVMEGERVCAGLVGEGLWEVVGRCIPGSV